MWSALRADLKEFVSAITEDGANVLSSIDTIRVIGDIVTDEEYNRNSTTATCATVDVSDEEQQNCEYNDVVGKCGSSYTSSLVVDEVERRMGLVDTYTYPLLPHEVNGTMNDTLLSVGTDDENKTEERDFAKDCARNETRQVDDGSRQEDVNIFLENFDILSKDDDISKILELHSDTVGLHFDKLVPAVVTYAQFWQRFYYRCNFHRIQSQWDLEEDEIFIEKKELIGKGVDTMTNLWGEARKLGDGALQVLKNVNKKEKQQNGNTILEKYQTEVENQQKAVESKPSETVIEGRRCIDTGIGIGLFRDDRAPFVINCEINVDKKKEFIDDKEEEDEDFVWDSEDEVKSRETVISLCTKNSNDPEEEITLDIPLDKSVEISQIYSQLAQVQLERDDLKSKARMQLKEIAQLKLVLASSTNDESKAEMDHLRKSIFVKSAELARLKGNLDKIYGENQNKIILQGHELKNPAGFLSVKNGEMKKIRALLKVTEFSKKQLISQWEYQSVKWLKSLATVAKLEKTREDANLVLPITNSLQNTNKALENILSNEQTKFEAEERKKEFPN